MSGAFTNWFVLVSQESVNDKEIISISCWCFGSNVVDR